MRLSGRDRAYDFLKRHVLTDPDMQGRFVNEQDLADRIGVSRTPIREALLMLSAEQLVRLVPKRGAYIAPMSGREITELMQLRGMVERFAAHQVLGSGDAPLDEMRDALRQQQEHRDTSQAKEFIEFDTLFHTALVRATGNRILTRMYEGLRDRQVQAGLVALHRSSDRQSGVIAEHQLIIDALATGDAEAAGAAIDRHLESTLRVQLMS